MLLSRRNFVMGCAMMSAGRGLLLTGAGSEYPGAQPQSGRPGTLWYVSDGFIWDDLPASYRTESGRPLECSSKLFVFNPQDKTARVKARFYQVDRPPPGIERSVGPGKIEAMELATLGEVPHKQSFWIAVTSDVPVLPQARHEDYTFWDPVPDALVSVAPYPGPLEDETTWIFPDCYQSSGKPWYELETLTILNPNQQSVKARIRWLLRGRDLGGEEEIEIPGERVISLEVMERYPRLLGTKNGPPVRVAGDYAVRIDATGPVVAQSTRRARWAGRPSIVGARSTMGFPLRGRGHDLWYYPGGAILDRGVLPRGSNSDVSWNLLFTHNPDERQKARATVTFHRGDGSSTRSEPLEIPPQKSDLQWLHLEPWLGKHTFLHKPWAMTVSADRPVVPEVTNAEYEMWSQGCPSAMTAVNFYPGPLKDERTWWLGIGQAGGADDINTEWSQAYQLFNPGREKTAHVTLSFLDLGEPGSKLSRAVEIRPGAVVRVESKEIVGLPLGRPFVVRADGDVPFCPQVFARTFTRGLPYTRAMYSFIGIPIEL